MKQRLLVMNGQKIVQKSVNGGDWDNVKVEKAGAIRPGIYNIHLSNQADKGKVSDGLILHSDNDYVYQQVGRGFVRHDTSSFIKLPEIASNSSIKYDSTGKAIVSNLSRSLSKGLSI